MPALVYLLVLVVFAAMDAVWLSNMVGRAYRPLIGEILAERPRLGPAAAFYLLYAAGLTMLAAAPAAPAGAWRTALVSGCALGLFAYGTYDLTNYATLRLWGPRITLIDLSWGVVSSGLSTAAVVAVAPRLARAMGLTP